MQWQKSPQYANMPHDQYMQTEEGRRAQQAFANWENWTRGTVGGNSPQPGAAPSSQPYGPGLTPQQAPRGGSAMSPGRQPYSQQSTWGLSGYGTPSNPYTQYEPLTAQPTFGTTPTRVGAGRDTRIANSRPLGGYDQTWGQVEQMIPLLEQEFPGIPRASLYEVARSRIGQQNNDSINRLREQTAPPPSFGPFDPGRAQPVFAPPQGTSYGSPPTWDWRSQPVSWDQQRQQWSDGQGGIRTLPNGAKVAIGKPNQSQNVAPPRPPQQTFQQPPAQQSPQPQYGPGEDLAKVQQKKRAAFEELGNMRRELLLLKNRREQVDYAGRLRGDDIRIANEIQAMEDRIQQYAMENGIRGRNGSGVAVF